MNIPGFKRRSRLATSTRTLAVRVCASTTEPMFETWARKCSSGYAVVVTSAFWPIEMLWTSRSNTSACTHTFERSAMVTSGGLSGPTNCPLVTLRSMTVPAIGVRTGMRDCRWVKSSSGWPSRPRTCRISSVCCTLALALASSLSDCWSDMCEAAWCSNRSFVIAKVFSARSRSLWLARWSVIAPATSRLLSTKSTPSLLTASPTFTARSCTCPDTGGRIRAMRSALNSTAPVALIESSGALVESVSIRTC